MADILAETAQLAEIADLTQTVVIRFTPATGAIWCSETAQAILSHPAASLAQDWSGDLALVSDGDRKAVAQARAGEGKERLLFRMMRGEDTIVSIDATFRLVAGTGRAETAVIAILRDVTPYALPDSDLAIFDVLSREARFIQCLKTNTVRFGTGLNHVYGIKLKGTYPTPSPYIDRIHPDDRGRVHHCLSLLAKNSVKWGEVEYRLRRGDGSYAVVRERCHIERDSAMAVQRVHSSVTDISDVHDERQRRELVARASGLVIIDFDPKSNRMQFSGAFKERLGYSVGETPATLQAYLDLVHPNDRPGLDDAIDAMRAGKIWTDPLELNYRLRRQDGSYAHVLDRSLTITGADGGARGFIAVLTDVSLLLREQEDLRSSNERLRALADLSGQVVFEVKLADGKVRWSGAVEEQFGFAPDAMPADPIAILDALHPDDRKMHEDWFDKLDRGEAWTQPLELSFRTRHRDGRHLHFIARSVCVLDRTGRPESLLAFLNNATAFLQKQDQLLAMTEIASDAAYEYYHYEGKVVFNHGFDTCFGHKLAGAHPLPFPWHRYVHPEDLDRLQGTFMAFIESDQPRFSCEYRLRRGDDRWAIVSQNSAALRDEEGRPILIIGTIDDVTEYRRAEARLSDAVEALDSGFALYDDEQRLVLHNRRFVLMNSGIADLIKPGVRRDDLLRGLIDRNLLMVPEKASLSQTQRGATPINAEITQANGLIYNIRFNKTKSGDWVSLVTDVTGVVQDQQKLRAMTDVSADAMFEYHVAKGTIVFDAGFKMHFGYDFHGAYTVPSPWESTVHPDDYARVREMRDEFIASRRVRFDVEFRMQRSDGSWAYVAERAVALRDDNGTALSILGAVADLTEQRMLEDKLHAAQKMESIGRISGGIAHDFNNLLAVIMGNAELLTLATDDPSLRQSIDEIVDASKRGAELTRRLLSFARRSRLAPERLDPNELVNGMGRLIARVLPATIRLHSGLQAGIWATRADPSFLESALLNLVINARDAMPDGGTLTIETANLRVTEDYGIERNEYVAPGRYVMLAVTDTGHGIPRELLDRVVEPFFTTKGPNLGSGLGLSMVDGFARQSGGLLRIYSEPEVGTTVKIFLPADPDDSRKGLAPMVRKPAEPAGAALHVLLVEDEARVRTVVARILKEAGLSVIEAESGDAALKLYAQMAERPDVLLTDVVMPGQLQGPALANRLRELQPGLQIVFMSGYANEAAINGNGLRPDDMFLMKPVQRVALLEAIYKISKLPKRT